MSADLVTGVGGAASLSWSLLKRTPGSGLSRAFLTQTCGSISTSCGCLGDRRRGLFDSQAPPWALSVRSTTPVPQVAAAAAGFARGLRGCGAHAARRGLTMPKPPTRRQHLALPARWRRHRHRGATRWDHPAPSSGPTGLSPPALRSCRAFENEPAVFFPRLRLCFRWSAAEPFASTSDPSRRRVESHRRPAPKVAR